jgi:hypothetical protein
METVETVMETDGDGSGGTSPSRQGAGTETSIPQNSSAAAAELQNSLPIVLGFSVGRLLIGEGASLEVDQGGLTMGGCGQSWVGPPCCVASPWPLSGSRLVLVLRPGKIGVSELVSSNSENISCVAFLKHKNSRKQGTGTVASC